jgi:hypothetical protein
MGHAKVVMLASSVLAGPDDRPVAAAQTIVERLVGTRTAVREHSRGQAETDRLIGVTSSDDTDRFEEIGCSEQVEPPDRQLPAPINH